MWRAIVGLLIVLVVFASCAPGLPVLPKYKGAGYGKLERLDERAAKSPLHAYFTGVEKYTLMMYSVWAETPESIKRFYDSSLGAAGWTKLDGEGYLADVPGAYQLRYQKGIDFVEILISGALRYVEWTVVQYRE